MSLILRRIHAATNSWSFEAYETLVVLSFLRAIVSSPTATMITDGDLYKLAILLGAVSMVLIVLYHFLEVNAIDEASPSEKKSTAKASSDPGSMQQNPTSS